MHKTTPIELLAPARDCETARQAILHGADAVYIGAEHHGARSAASNSTAEIGRLADFAHIYGARVYVTLNTIVFDNELSAVERLVRQLYHVSVDALIVQDMSLLRLDIPPIDLHASTQCDIRTPEKAVFLAKCGFSQLVLPREFSIAEIEAVRAAVTPDIRLEAFVHGALCVSYSGDCQASFAANGRSANRGECAQMCRMAWNLTDDRGNTLLRDRHLLSLRDLCRIDRLPQLACAGVSSFKIEGRLKDTAYVKNTVAAYRTAIDRMIEDSDGRFCRSSLGVSRISFAPDVEKSFNRGFTSYFIDGRPSAQVSMANLDTPKWVGEKIGTVVLVKGISVKARLEKAVNNGDGLGFMADGSYHGFRVNRADPSGILHLAPGFDTSILQKLKPGTNLFRNNDVAFRAMLDRETAVRVIPVRLTLSSVSKNGDMLLTLRAAVDGTDIAVDITVAAEAQTARTPQRQARAKVLAKLGETPFVPADSNAIADLVSEDTFIRASVLTDLRRRVTTLLETRMRMCHRFIYRRAADAAETPQAPISLSYHDNVANSVAEKLYRDLGTENIQPTLECASRAAVKPGTVVMTTRYCLRRQLGACLRESGADKLPTPLYITNRAATYRLSFDCANCQMHLHTT